MRAREVDNPKTPWPLVPLKRVLKFRNGEPYAHVESSDGDYPVYGSGGEFAQADDYLHEGTSVLFGRKGTVDKPLLVHGRFWCIDTMFYTRFSPSVDPRFVHYFATTIPYSLLATDTARPSMTQTDLGEVKMPFPTLEEQRAIADFLDRETAQIDAMIEAQAHLVALLQERRAAELLTSITRGLNPSATLGPSSVNWIGDSPLHWQFAQIKRLSPVLRGASPRPIENPEYFNEEGDHGWVRISDVTASRDGVLLQTTQTLSELGVSLSVPLVPGQLFVSIAGSVGKACIAGIKCCIHDGFVYFPRLDLNPRWLYRIFEAGACFAGLGKLGTQLNLNTDTIGAIVVPLPPEYEIEDILGHLEREITLIDTLIRDARKVIGLLRERREALITAAVTGKIDRETGIERIDLSTQKKAS